MSKTKVVFFGTGPVAAKSLELLLKHCAVEAVITKPKPSHHRGSFPVLEVATTNNLKVFEATDKKSLSALVAQTKFESKVGVLIDFGIIVGQDVIDKFEKGIVNSHFSLLPEWRGADPITFSILSGQKKTGVSLMVIDTGMDTGKLITSRTHHISPAATTEELTTELITLSDELLQEFLPKYLSSEIKPRSQPHPDRATYSRKLTKEDGVLDFTKPAEVLEREIRAFAQWPKSRTELGGMDVIITKAYVVPSTGPDDKPGDVVLVPEAHSLAIATSNGSLWIERLQPAGKKEMTIAEFLRGYRSRL